MRNLIVQSAYTYFPVINQMGDSSFQPSVQIGGVVVACAVIISLVGFTGYQFSQSKRKDLWILAGGLLTFVVSTVGYMQALYPKYQKLFVTWVLIAVVTAVLMYIARAVQKKG